MPAPRPGAIFSREAPLRRHPEVDSFLARCNRLHLEVHVSDPRNAHTKTIGWIGVGRMGAALVERLIRAGCDVSVYNRTRSKAEPS